MQFAAAPWGSQGPPGPMGWRWEVTDFRMEDYEIENFRHGMFLPDSLNAKIGRGRWLGQGRNLANGLGLGRVAIHFHPSR